MVRHDADAGRDSGRHRPVISTPSGAPHNGLTRWTVGAVLTLLMLAVPALAKVVWQRLDDQQAQITQQQQETTRLAVALARNEAQHETMLTILHQVSEDLKDFRRESRRRR